MDRGFRLFADFGPVTIRPTSGFGISVDGTNFALAPTKRTIPQFEAEGSKPFSYQTRAKKL